MSLVKKRHETRQAIQLAISQVLMESQTVEQAGRQILQSVGHLADWLLEGERAIRTWRRDGIWLSDPDEGLDAEVSITTLRMLRETTDYWRGWVRT
mgnify:CR=1 FL=1